MDMQLADNMEMLEQELERQMAKFERLMQTD